MQYPSYNPASDNLPLSDEELGQLDDLLADLPSDGAMNIEALDGYLTALLLSPVPVASLAGEAWIPLVWGGDGEGQAPFTSGKQRKKATLLVLRHLNSLAHTLSREPQAWEPIFSQAEEDGQELVDAEDWCTGFMIGVDLGGEAWAPRFENDATAALLAPIVLLGGAEDQLRPEDLARLHDLHQLDALSREVPEAVLGLCKQTG
ncbi:uncharacterized protein HNQ51_000557 [Inhella inkyongensis]|uniref:YecA family protein n=1 Tax=Inhella inkyongensis TaxID=392593 RepID=A0A840S349_9BURK|nr:UPF0149 family protein [Inhella inkyongensis]MBB5203264.1 uncharacterized protein [Inhella inkyongensis]